MMILYYLKIGIYVGVLCVGVAMFVALYLFKQEMKNKAKYKEFLDDAVDGVENNFGSNNDYAHPSKKGISFSKLPNGKIKMTSQSALTGTAIKY